MRIYSFLTIELLSMFDRYINPLIAIEKTRDNPLKLMYLNFQVSIKKLVFSVVFLGKILGD